MTDNSNGTNRTTQAAPNSTLLEFPGANRNRPAWRKELSERFREIQQRRARESALDAEDLETRYVARDEAEHPRAANESAKPSDTSKQLGLVPPPPDEPEMNPLVAAALRRIERARTQTTSHARQGSRGYAATAAARVVEEQPEQFADQAPEPAIERKESSDAKRASRRAERSEGDVSQSRPSTLAVVAPKQSHETTMAATVEGTNIVAETKATAPAAATVEVKERAEILQSVGASQQAVAAQSQTQSTSRQPRHITGVLDEFWIERQGLDPLPKVATPELSYDDSAPRAKRIAAAIVDLIAVAFLAAPFAAAIELTISNWGDPRVYGSMAGIVAVVALLYHTCSVALAGHTWGMTLCSLRVVDSRTALVPTTGQCARRSLVFILSLLTLGIGIAYSLFDAEGRTAHDILSGTVVVKQ
jgi:uncharacterized RDD family membrane protein YckC